MAMTDDKALFVDTNILVYANVIETPFHQQAFDALNAAHEAARPIWISRQVIREYLVTLTRPQAFEDLPQAKVLAQLALLLQRFNIADDTDAVTTALTQLMTAFKIGGKQVHDANIVATMQANGISSLLTHNVKDFKRFESIIKIEGI